MPEMTNNTPLFNKTVLITRASHQFDSLAEKFESWGAAAIACPVIEILPPEDPTDLDTCLRQIDDYAMVLFLSSNAVQGTVARIREIEPPAIRFPLVAAIGKGTLGSLESAGIDVQLTPPHANSESMATAVVEFYRNQQTAKPVLILRANRGSDLIPKSLAAAGIPFREVAAYRSVDVLVANAEISQRIADGKIDWITITSSAIAKNVAKLFGAAVSASATKIAAISPTTTAAGMDAGLVVDAEAIRYDLDGLVDAIVQHERTARK